MAFKSKKDGKKKKGPKGKRARAKAKLERQWGETVDESQVKGLRRGKSRLSDDVPSSSKERSTHNDRDEEMDVHVSSEESDAEGDEGALNILLTSISKKSRNTSSRQLERMPGDNDNASSDDESSSEMSMDNRKDLIEESDGDGQDSMSDDDDVVGDDNDNEPSDIDPFSSHFNREPLAEKELCQAVTVSQKTVKVSLPNLGSSLELLLNEGSEADDAMSLFGCNRKVLRRSWKKVNGPVLRRSNKENMLLSPLQSVLFPSLATYKDAFIAAETRENRDEINNIVALHLLNHILTSRGRIQRNNKKAKNAEDDAGVEAPRDQGFTRPTVLVLLPTRGTCYSFVKKLLELLGNPAHVENMDRFDAEYGPLEIDGDEDEKQLKRRKAVMEAKGPGWQELFGEAANSDDDFKIGVSLAPKTASKGDGGVWIKLYTDFYRSDLIIASPLGLKMALDSKDDDTTDTDFLSSIEICLVEHSSVLLMQNWDHVNGVLKCLNQQPKKNNDTDFGRVRNYLLSGQAENWRQLILTSSLSDPYIVSTFKRHAKSLAGRLKLRRRTASEDASLCNVLVRVKQVFQRISCNSFAEQGSDKLRFFEQRILPQIRKQKRTMVFIPSYFDFVSVRNLLLKKEIEFVSVTEYARVSEVTRGRARFLQGIKPLMLYTGRAHFFQRHVIKGVRHLILHGIPEHGEFYSELVNNLNAGLEREESMEDLDLASPLSCLSLFTKYDGLALERIVGNEHCQRMVKGEKSTFMFCS